MKERHLAGLRRSASKASAHSCEQNTMVWPFTVLTIALTAGF